MIHNTDIMERGEKGEDTSPELAEKTSRFKSLVGWLTGWMVSVLRFPVSQHRFPRIKF